MSRARHLLIAAVGCALLAAPAVRPPGKRLVFNTTSSAPLGFYWTGSGAPVVGELALVRPPKALARWMAGRRYLPLNVPLIKRVAAVDGQFVCVRGGAVAIDGARVATVLERDHLGRALTAASICRRLWRGEVFLLNSAPHSLDGRYFGPLSHRYVVGRLTPLWTWDR